MEGDILENLSKDIVDVLMSWCFLPEISIRWFFVVMILTATLIFNVLENRIEAIFQTLDRTNQVDRNELSCQLENWRHHYDLACQLVDQINDNFGYIILFNLTYGISVSIGEFFEFTAMYAFAVQIFARIDVNKMMEDFPTTLESLGIEPRDDAITLCIFSSFDMLSRSASVKQMGQIQMARNAKEIVLFWIRLLIILIPAYRLVKNVLIYFIKMSLI